MTADQPLLSFELDLPLLGARDYLQALAIAGEAVDRLQETAAGFMAARPRMRRFACHGPAQGRIRCDLWPAAEAARRRRQAAVEFLFDSAAGDFGLLISPTGVPASRAPDQRPAPVFHAEGRLTGHIILDRPQDFRAIFEGLYVVAKEAHYTVWPAGTPVVFLQAFDTDVPLDTSIIDRQVTMRATPAREYEAGGRHVTVLDIACTQPDKQAYSLRIMCSVAETPPW